MKRALQLLVLVLLATALPLVTSSSVQAQEQFSIEVVYAIPTGATRNTQIEANIPATVEAVQVFLQQDVGRTLRITPGVSFARFNNGSATSIRDQLVNQGFGDTNKIYLVFAESQGGGGACGISLSASNTPSYSMLLMPTCDIYPGNGAQTFPFNATYLVLHELLHSLGAVPSCSPNHAGGGHSNDSAADILSAIGRDWDNLTLDPGNDDYYGHNISGCPDLEDSPFWADTSTGSGARCAGAFVTIDMTQGDSGNGTAGNDVILGTSGDDVINGFGGNDTICAGAGADTVSGGLGNDKLFGAQGADRLSGDDGDDVIHGNRGNDVLDGGTGADRIFGYAGNDTIFGGPGADRLHGNFGDDLMRGGSGDDRMFGYGDNDTLTGGPGNDVLGGNFGDDELDGEADDDNVYGSDGADIVNGGDGNDDLEGNSGNDHVNGGNGNDLVDGGINNDVCTGGAGRDVANRCETQTGFP